MRIFARKVPIIFVCTSLMKDNELSRAEVARMIRVHSPIARTHYRNTHALKKGIITCFGRGPSDRKNSFATQRRVRWRVILFLFIKRPLSIVPKSITRKSFRKCIASNWPNRFSTVKLLLQIIVRADCFLMNACQSEPRRSYFRDANFFFFFLHYHTKIR